MKKASPKSAKSSCGMLAAAGTIISVFPIVSPAPKTPRRNPSDDAQAIAGDWKRVGEALHQAMGRLENDLAPK